MWFYIPGYLTLEYVFHLSSAIHDEYFSRLSSKTSLRNNRHVSLNWYHDMDWQPLIIWHSDKHADMLSVPMRSAIWNFDSTMQSSIRLAHFQVNAWITCIISKRDNNLIISPNWQLATGCPEVICYGLINTLLPHTNCCTRSVVYQTVLTWL